MYASVVDLHAHAGESGALSLSLRETKPRIMGVAEESKYRSKVPFSEDELLFCRFTHNCCTYSKCYLYFLYSQLTATAAVRLTFGCHATNFARCSRLSCVTLACPQPSGIIFTCKTNCEFIKLCFHTPQPCVGGRQGEGLAQHVIQ